ncbi:transposase [Pseudomonas syringae]|uniref:transposase n=1 Tax=Pseudomonas syringae TaxID=317 RepID=UPI0011120F13
MQPQRRSYSKSFKAQVIQECSQPGASIANIALSHSLNANLVHKWIRVQRRKPWCCNLLSFRCPCSLPGQGRKSRHRLFVSKFHTHAARSK